MPCIGCSALHGVNPNYFPIKCISFGQPAGQKDPKMPNHEQGHFERNLSLQFHLLHLNEVSSISKTHMTVELYLLKGI